MWDSKRGEQNYHGRSCAFRLFWFGWPKLLLWLTLLAIVINATSITLFVDLLINYEDNPTAEATLIYWPNLTALW